MTPLRVFIAADDPLARAGLDSLVRAYPDLAVAGEEAADGLRHDALRGADPDVVKAIAGRLGLSEHTVKFHVDAILGKLGAHSRTEAVTRAARMGLLVL